VDTSRVIPLSEPDINCDPGNYYGSIVLSFPEKDERPREGHAMQISCYGPHTPPDQAARLEHLDSPQPSSGMAFFRIKMGWAGHLHIDGSNYKNVLIINAAIDYDGGPLRLENVMFVNCQFFLRQTQPSREFGKAILAADYTNFRNPAI
jgi:hypothetical protein